MASFLNVCLLLGVVAGSYGQVIYDQGFETQNAYGQNANEENYDLNAVGQNTYNYDPIAAEQNAGTPNSVQYANEQNTDENEFVANDFVNTEQYAATPQENYARNAFVNSQNSYPQYVFGQNSYAQNPFRQNYNNQYVNVPNFNRQYRRNGYGQNAYASASAQAAAQASAQAAAQASAQASAEASAQAAAQASAQAAAQASAQASASSRAGSQYYDEVLGFRVYRPCPDLNIDCIRNYFAANGQCNRVSGSIPNPLYQQVSNYYYPSVNMSLSQIGNVITGLNGTVNNFYVNPTTGITFLSVDYNEITIVTEANRFLYHLNGVEPVVGQVSSSEYFPKFQIATIFRGNGRVSLANSYSVGFLDNVPILDIYNPTEAEITNPLVSYLLSQLRSNFNIFVRESFVNRAEFFTAAFVQYYICDFGLSLNQPSNLPGAV